MLRTTRPTKVQIIIIHAQFTKKRSYTERQKREPKENFTR